VIETAAMLVARAAFDLLGLPDLRLPARLGARYFAEELELAPADPARAPFAEIADALDAATAEARTWTAVLRDANRWQTRCTALTEALAFAGTALA
jgi:hypothetical protein